MTIFIVLAYTYNCTIYIYVPVFEKEHKLR